ncbi:hypothetical protein HY745_13380, partial [Candidatus Desantisbacteria bacterium]|nr:hypothetical protein [Candidatus Desantisbacteria bacterium]
MNYEINNTIFAQAFNEWDSAQYGTKSFIVTKWADALNISYQTMHRKFKNFGHNLSQRKGKYTKGKPLIPHLHDWAQTIAHMYAFIPQKIDRRPPLSIVIKKALLNGMLPKEAENVSVGTFARVLREQRLIDKAGRVLRFEAKTPMEQIQYDCSGSEYLYVHRFDENGEAILRARSSKSYKNRERYENFRVWYHGMIDDSSRYWLAMPFVAPGESSADAIKFCKWAFSKKD